MIHFITAGLANTRKIFSDDNTWRYTPTYKNAVFNRAISFMNKSIAVYFTSEFSPGPRFRDFIILALTGTYLANNII